MTFFLPWSGLAFKQKALPDRQGFSAAMSVTS